MNQKLNSDSHYPLPLKILGIGSYLPSRIVTNNELETHYDLEKGWCENNLGIKERRWIDEETPSIMGKLATEAATDHAGIDMDEVDLIIDASTTASYEQIIPGGASLVQRHLRLGNSGIPCFTMQNNSLSFLMAMQMSAAMLNAGRYQTILIISSEVYSHNLDFSNPEVFSLFSDGAGAAIITLPDEGETSAIHNVRFETYGQGAYYMQSLIGMAMLQNKQLQPKDLTLKINSTSFYEYAGRYTSQLMGTLLKEQKSFLKDLKYIIPQPLGKQYLKECFANYKSKIFDSYKQRGFCGSASFPMALDDAVKTKKIQRGDKVLMIGAGAGITVGNILLTY